MSHANTQLPQHGQPKSTLLSQMQQARDHDVNWQEGKAFSLVFLAGEVIGMALVIDLVEGFRTKDKITYGSKPQIHEELSQVIEFPVLSL